MRLGIVGSEGKKFTPETEAKAREIIRTYLKDATTVISGGCHLGGIDIWAIEEARSANIPTIEHFPKVLSWESGYKQRNLKIAQDSDHIICITLKELPPTYVGMKFSHCYHCNTDKHIKSGGCWTVKQAIKLGKTGEVIVISNDPETKHM